MRIAIVSGSTRVNRLSNRVAFALCNQLEEMGVTAITLDLGQMDIPFFKEVLAEQSNPNADLMRFNQEITNAEGILFVSPEYNGSYTPALKNAVDHLDETAFRKKVIGVVSVSAGKLGGMRGAMQMQNLVLGLWGYPIPHMLLVSEIKNTVDQNGKIFDEQLQQKFTAFLDDFLWLTRAVDRMHQPISESS